MSRAYAATIIGSHEARLKRLGLTPTADRLWLAWTMGFAGAKAIGFEPTKAPAYKQRGLARLKAKLGGKSATTP